MFSDVMTCSSARGKAIDKQDKFDLKRLRRRPFWRPVLRSSIWTLLDRNTWWIKTHWIALSFVSDVRGSFPKPA
jgi:hypothetical protein